MPNLQQLQEEIKELSRKLVENSILLERLIVKREQDSASEPDFNTYNVIDTFKKYVKCNIEIIIYSLHNLALSSDSKKQVLIETTIQEIIIKAIKLTNIAQKYLDQDKTIDFVNNLFATVHKFNKEKTHFALNKSIDEKLKIKKDINTLNNLIIVMKQNKLKREVNTIIAKLNFYLVESISEFEQQYLKNEIEKITKEYTILVANYSVLQKILSFHPDLQNDDDTIKKLAIHTDILERAKLSLAKINAIDETKEAVTDLIDSANNKEKQEATSKIGFWGVVTNIFEKLTKKPYNPVQGALEMVKNDPTIISGTIENKKIYLPSFAVNNIEFKVGKLSHTYITFSRDEQHLAQQCMNSDRSKNEQQQLIAPNMNIVNAEQGHNNEVQQSISLRRTSSTPNLAAWTNASVKEILNDDEEALALGFEVVKHDHVRVKARCRKSLSDWSKFSEKVNSEIDVEESKNLPCTSGKIVTGLSWI